MGIEMSAEELRQARQKAQQYPNKPHKHAELIKAWADGAEIQYKFYNSATWHDSVHPIWDLDIEYRIKPKTIKYRNYLWRCSEAEHRVHISVAYTDSAINNPAFITWIGDWQEVEV